MQFIFLACNLYFLLPQPNLTFYATISLQFTDSIFTETVTRISGLLFFPFWENKSKKLASLPSFPMALIIKVKSRASFCIENALVFILYRVIHIERLTRLLPFAEVMAVLHSFNKQLSGTMCRLLLHEGEDTTAKEMQFLLSRSVIQGRSCAGCFWTRRKRWFSCWGWGCWQPLHKGDKMWAETPRKRSPRRGGGDHLSRGHSKRKGTEWGSTRMECWGTVVGDEAGALWVTLWGDWLSHWGGWTLPSRLQRHLWQETSLWE